MATIDQYDPSAFDLLVCCLSPLSRSQLHVDFRPVYDRQRHPDSQLEETINKVWEKRIAAQPSIFNASKFRYGGFEVTAQNGAHDKVNVVLRLGLTDYKAFIGTNLSPDWEKFLASATDDVARCKYTADPLGNGAVVETKDGQILLLQRSMDVGEFPGYIVFPGGHSEPDEVGIKSHSATDTATTTTTELNKRIAEEMFDGIIREIVEETGVASSTLSEPVFIGVSRRKLNVRPTAFFYVKCSLTSAEVMDVYKHAEHSFESTVLLSSSSDELLESAGTKMPGCHHGGAVLYQMMRKELAQISTDSSPVVDL
ncbi:unnamed protein product [Calypogeia fissa]